MRVLLSLLALVGCALALECVTGFTYLRGQMIGTEKKTCKSPFDYCYNATADVNEMSSVKKAGCSSTKCFIARNKCISQIVEGRKLKFCCCNNGDLCNSREANMSPLEEKASRAKDIFKGIFGSFGGNKEANNNNGGGGAANQNSNPLSGFLGR